MSNKELMKQQQDAKKVSYETLKVFTEDERARKGLKEIIKSYGLMEPMPDYTDSHAVMRHQGSNDVLLKLVEVLGTNYFDLLRELRDDEFSLEEKQTTTGTVNYEKKHFI